MLEDDVVSSFAHALRSIGHHVLAQGGNQGANFRYKVSRGFKSPDVVSFYQGHLLIAEGKVRPADLFKVSAKGVSDFSAVTSILTSKETCLSLADEAARRMATFSSIAIIPEKVVVRSALFANGKLTAWDSVAQTAGVSLFEVSQTGILWQGGACL